MPTISTKKRKRSTMIKYYVIFSKMKKQIFPLLARSLLIPSACFNLKSRMKNIKNLSMSAGIVTMAILLGSALLAPTFSAYADKGHDEPKNNNSPKSHDNNQSNGNHGNNQSHGTHDDHHKKGKKDTDKDKDNDHKACENGDKNKNDKYKHSCDSDHDFKK